MRTNVFLKRVCRIYTLSFHRGQTNRPACISDERNGRRQFMRRGRGVVLRRSARTETLSFYSIAPAFVDFLARYQRGEQVFRARSTPSSAIIPEVRIERKEISSMTSFKVNFVHRGANVLRGVLNASTMFASIVRSCNERARFPLRRGSREGLATRRKIFVKSPLCCAFHLHTGCLHPRPRVCILKIKGYCSSEDMALALKLYLQRDNNIIILL